MIFWILLLTLLIMAAGGASYFAQAKGPLRHHNYSAYVISCALLFAALPISTGQPRWSLVLLPLGLVAGGIIISRKQR